MLETILMIFLYIYHAVYGSYNRYFDTAASAPINIKALYSFIKTSFVAGNSLGSNRSASNLKNLEKQATENILKILDETTGEIIYTSGATESNNIAIQGVIKQFKRAHNTRAHIVTSSIEHKSILNILEHIDVQYTLVKPDRSGRINVDDIRNAIREDTVLVSLHTLNNESGVVQDIEKVYQLCKEMGILFHTDASQGFCMYDNIHADFITLSGHKIGAPKGIGALYIRDRNTCAPIMYGGGDKLRPGTMPTELIVSFATAASEKKAASASIKKKMRYLMNALRAIENVEIITEDINHIVFIKLRNIFEKDLLERLSEFDLSNGASCNQIARSYVAQEMGVADHMQIDSFLRISINEHTPYRAIDNLIANLIRVCDEYAKYMRDMEGL